MCDDNDGDYSSCHMAAWRTARKAHRCIACHEPIRAGHRYCYQSGVYDGMPYSYKHCARCKAMLDALHKRSPHAAIAVELDCGEVWENPPADVAALAFALPQDFTAKEAC